MLGVTLSGASRMGDKLQFASFPENYYKNTGEKVIDLDCAWVFDHNPFVVRGEAPTSVVNLWRHPWPQLSANTRATILFKTNLLFYCGSNRLHLQACCLSEAPEAVRI